MKVAFDIKIIVYIIIIVLLVFAFISVNVYKDLTAKENRTKGYNETNKTTNGLGFCNVPQDCESQGLVHIQCVGNWICEQNRCGWICVTEGLPQPQGGLSGSTVECY